MVLQVFLGNLPLRVQIGKESGLAEVSVNKAVRDTSRDCRSEREYQVFWRPFLFLELY